MCGYLQESDAFICNLVAVYSFSWQVNINTELCTRLFLHLIIYVWWAIVPRKGRDVGMWVA